MNLNKRLSLAHPEGMPECPNHYYHIIKNTSEEIRNEIYDIYFGSFFKYTYNNEERYYGNTMAVEATKEQIDNLFKIQKEFGIEISLTMNSMDVPDELHNDFKLRNEFVEFIGSFYDRGLRSCTISWVHLMRTGMLQQRCPEMRWKNTVNHIVSDTQKVVDYIYLGYDTILLDRSYNRNIKELKKTRKLVDKYNKGRDKKILLSLLGREGCIYSCPFKQEHDSFGARGNNYFSSVGQMTCTMWRGTVFRNLPRNGVGLVANTKEVMEMVFDNIDVLKSSGRFESHSNLSEQYIIDNNIGFTWRVLFDKEMYISNSFKELYSTIDRNFMSWELGLNDSSSLTIKNIRDNLSEYYNSNDNDKYFWNHKKSDKLEHILLNCQSQCYDCHECEKEFGVPEVDSALQVQ